MKGETKSSDIILPKLVAIILATVGLLLLSILSLLAYRRDLNSTLAKMTKQDLERYTNQSILLFQNIVDDYFRKLDMFAQFCNKDTENIPDYLLRLLKENNQDSAYERLGVGDIDGMLYTGVNPPINISKQDYFMRAVKGERVISNVIKNKHSGKDVIVFAIPVKREDQIVGIICAQYNVQIFTDLLGNSQFAGEGATMVMQKNGQMVSSYPGMENYPTFYEALVPMEFRDGESLDGFKQRVENGESGFITYYRNGKARYLYFKPTDVNDCVMISLVMAEKMDQDAKIISRQAFFLMVKNVCIYCLVLI